MVQKLYTFAMDDVVPVIISQSPSVIPSVILMDFIPFTKMNVPKNTINNRKIIFFN